MQEVLYEETAKVANEKSAKIKYIIGKVIMIISYVFAVVWGIVLFSFIDLNNLLISLLSFILPVAVFVVTGIFVGKIKDRFYVDYDYTFVTGSVRFSKVIYNIKRRPVIQFDCKDIEKIGEYGSDVYERYASSPNLKPEILTQNSTAGEGKSFYYFVVNAKSEKRLFVLECSQSFLLNVYKFSSKIVFEDGLFKKKQ